MKMQRSAGILLPISSLPSPYGIGCFSQEAYDFVDWLKETGQTYWQILPLGPTSYGDSPYQSFSTYAGNPYFIDLDDLAKQGLLLPEEYASIDWECHPDCINYGVMYEKALRSAALCSQTSAGKARCRLPPLCEGKRLLVADYALSLR